MSIPRAKDVFPPAGGGRSLPGSGPAGLEHCVACRKESFTGAVTVTHPLHLRGRAPVRHKPHQPSQLALGSANSKSQFLLVYSLFCKQEMSLDTTPRVNAYRFPERWTPFSQGCGLGGALEFSFATFLSAGGQGLGHRGREQEGLPGMPDLTK